MYVSMLKHKSGEGNAGWLMLSPGATGGFSAEGQGWRGRKLWLDSELRSYFCFAIEKKC